MIIRLVSVISLVKQSTLSVFGISSYPTTYFLVIEEKKYNYTWYGMVNPYYVGSRVCGCHNLGCDRDLQREIEVWELSCPTTTRWVTRNEKYSYGAYNAFIMCGFRVHGHHIHDNGSEVSYQV